MLASPLVNDIIERINDQDFYALYVTAIRGFEKDPITLPINKITFSVTPEENKTTYFTDVDSMLCVRNDIRIRLNVYAPTNRNGSQINSFADLVLDYLAETYMDQLKSYRIGDMSYDDSVNAMLLPCYMEFSYVSCALDTEQTEPGSHVPENFFCKNHVNNQAIHVSEDDRLRLTSPYTIGSFTGNGSADGQDIVCGFRPTAVIVYRNSYHISSYNNSDELSHCYAGFAIGVSYTRGILLTDTGFRVKTVATSNATTHLNDSGGNYTFMAFR